jgi:hypothetical protein
LFSSAIDEDIFMAKTTSGKRTTGKAALKRRTAAGRKPMRAQARTKHPGGPKPSRDEVKRVVPRMKRA